LKKQASRFFDRIANQGWHKSDFFTYTWKYPALRRWLIAQLRSSEKRILSIGCGSGELERDLIKTGRYVVALDIAHDMLRAAARRGVKNLVRADARQLPFAEGSFDAAMFMESVGYFDADIVLRQVRRVLTRRGRLIITAYPPHHESDDLYKKVGPRKIANDLRRRGFQIAFQQMLSVNRNGIGKATSEDGSPLLYVMAQKQVNKKNVKSPKT
jgi:ubiquinone/menaquinone biosynthesis C-methylase UbiE